MKTLPSQHGFTLIEAMVALLIFSAGLLGLAGMQMAGMQNNHGALMRTIATQYSYDMADRIRSRKAALPFLQADFDEWEASLANSLPSGTGSIEDLGNNSIQISVYWDEERSGVTGLGCDPKNANDMRCLRLTIVP